MRLNSMLGLSAALCCSASAATIPTPRADALYATEQRDGVVHSIWEDPASGATVSFVNNSGICETTPGVNHYAGYLSTNAEDHMWFWLFEARNNPEEAPLVLYFAGGPGCSGLMGAFVTNGPCRFSTTSESEPSLNPHSYTEHANVLYIDQPVPAGFSYGNGTQPRSTKEAAVVVYDFLQLFLERFPSYRGRDVGLFTSSYGGHYGPELARLILERNDGEAVAAGERHEIKLTALAIDNGWFDASIQERANIDFAHSNPIRQLINDTLYEEVVESFETTHLPLIEKCAAEGTDEVCSGAYKSYSQDMEYVILGAWPEGTRSFDIRPGASDVPSAEEYLAREDVRKAIGAQKEFDECSWPTGFFDTGDDARSFLDELSSVVRAGTKVLIWTGDADYVCNWMGTMRVAEACDWPGREVFADKEMGAYTVNGEEKASFKTEENLTYMTVYGAGHQMPWYQPELALQVFKQFMGPDGIKST